MSLRTFLVKSMTGGTPKPMTIDPDTYTPPTSPGTEIMNIPVVPGGKGKAESGLEDCFGQYRSPVPDCMDCPVNFQCGAVMIAHGKGMEKGKKKNPHGEEVPVTPEMEKFCK